MKRITFYFFKLAKSALDLLGVFLYEIYIMIQEFLIKQVIKYFN